MRNPVPWTKGEMADELEFRRKLVNLRTAEAVTLRAELDQAAQELTDLTGIIAQLTRERDKARATYKGLWDYVHAGLEADELTAETTFFLITGEQLP